MEVRCRRAVVPDDLPDAAMLGDMPAWDQRPYLWNRLDLSDIRGSGVFVVAALNGRGFFVACDCGPPRTTLLLDEGEPVPEGREPVPLARVEIARPGRLSREECARLLADGQTVLVNGVEIKHPDQLPPPVTRTAWVGQCPKCGRIFWQT